MSTPESALAVSPDALPVYFQEAPLFKNRRDFIRQMTDLVGETANLILEVRRSTAQAQLHGIKLGQYVAAWANSPEMKKRMDELKEERKGQRGKPRKATSVVAEEIAEEVHLSAKWLEKCTRAWERYRDSGFTLRPDVKLLANSTDPEKAGFDGEEAGVEGFDPKRALEAPEDGKPGKRPARSTEARQKKAAGQAKRLVSKVDNLVKAARDIKGFGSEDAVKDAVDALRRLAEALGVKLPAAKAAKKARKTKGTKASKPVKAAKKKAK